MSESKKIGDDLVARGYKFPERTIRTKDTLHFLCDAEHGRNIARALTLTSCCNGENGTFRFSYMNCGVNGHVGYQNSLVDRSEVSEANVIEALSYILENLADFLKDSGTWNTINSDVLDYILNK